MKTTKFHNLSPSKGQRDQKLTRFQPSSSIAIDSGTHQNLFRTFSDWNINAPPNLEEEEMKIARLRHTTKEITLQS